MPGAQLVFLVAAAVFGSPEAAPLGRTLAEEALVDPWSARTARPPALEPELLDPWAHARAAPPPARVDRVAILPQPELLEPWPAPDGPRR